MKFKVSILLIVFAIITWVIPLHAFAQDAAPSAGDEPAVTGETSAGGNQPSEADYLLNLDDNEGENPATVPAASSAGGIIRAILVFIVILGLIFGFFIVLKKVSGKKFHNNNLINIVSSQALSGNKSLHLVEVGGEIYLVGAADNGVNLVARIEDKETRDKLRLDISSDKPTAKNSFRDILGALFSGQKGNAAKQEGSADFIRQQGDRLKKL